MLTVGVVDYYDDAIALLQDPDFEYDIVIYENPENREHSIIICKAGLFITILTKLSIECCFAKKPPKIKGYDAVVVYHHNVIQTSKEMEQIFKPCEVFYLSRLSDNFTNGLEEDWNETS